MAMKEQGLWCFRPAISPSQTFVVPVGTSRVPQTAVRLPWDVLGGAQVLRKSKEAHRLAAHRGLVLPPVQLGMVST